MKNFFLFSLLILFMSCEKPQIVAIEDETSNENHAKLGSYRFNFYKNLAFHHAPIFYQDVDRTSIAGSSNAGLGGKSDYISRYDFDGDKNTNNNWENLAGKRPSAVGYFSVAETETHYYILYAFYHARDWDDAPWWREDSHENDMEGILMAVWKNNARYGELEAAITVFHKDFYSYKKNGHHWTSGAESVDGELSFQWHNDISRAEFSSEAKGHGIKAYSKQKPGGSDYVVYKPSVTTRGVPRDPYDRNVPYKLEHLIGAGKLWNLRNDSRIFDGAAFVGGNYKRNAANPPWGWNDHNDQMPGGAMAYKPAELFKNYFDTKWSNVSTKYIHNPYLNIP